MKILLSYIGYPVSAGKYFKKALRNMGHEIVHIGPCTNGTLPWMPGKTYADQDTPDIVLDKDVHALSVKEALKMANGGDLVIQADANFHLTGSSPVPNVVWMIDNHVADYKDSAQDAHILFGAHSWGYHHEDKRFVWLPCAYSPSDHYQMNAEKKCDLMFIGVVYPHRAALIQELAKYGIVYAGTGVIGEEYNAYYNSAKIGLCLSACGDVPMRVFENAAQGLLVFCDNQRDLSRLGLKDGTHYIGFGSMAEAVTKFQTLLKSPELIVRIAQQGKEALKNETYEARAQTIFGYL